jgi:pimeloyl-ACP methyl ester carboxylesterase
MATPVIAAVDGGKLVGSRAGSGAPTLVLHGGPGMSDYTEGLEDELAGVCELVRYTQRGVEPSTTSGPFTVEQHVADAVAMLDAAGWDRAWVLGHSWGGHLAMHLAISYPDRLVGVISVSALGSAGDGGAAEFEAEMAARTPPESRDRAEELDKRAMAGMGTEEDALESLRMVWPAYFAHPEDAAPMPPIRLSVACYAETFESLTAHLKAGYLEQRLPAVALPALLVHGRFDPIPYWSAEQTAALIPDVSLEPIEDCGHFPWLEQPGELRRHIARFLARH